MNAGNRDVLASDGVLANLPRTRPQRASARREQARRTATGSAVATAPAPTRPPRAAATAKTQPSPTPKPAAAKKAPAKAKTGPTKTGPTRIAKPKVAPRAKAKARPTPAARRVQDPVPRQGFETEGDPVSGPVQPPGSVDLLSSAAELAGELTKSGLSSGGRLLKDFLTRLPLN